MILFDVHRNRHIVPWADVRQHGLITHVEGFDKFLDWLCLSPEGGQSLSKQKQKEHELKLRMHMAEMEVNRTKALLAQQGIEPSHVN